MPGTCNVAIRHALDGDVCRWRCTTPPRKAQTNYGAAPGVAIRWSTVSDASVRAAGAAKTAA